MNDKFAAAKNVTLNADQQVINRQMSDAIKQLNHHVRSLKKRIAELEEERFEKFKYLKGNISEGRTRPNADGEVIFKSGNNTIDVKVEENYIDLRVR